MNRMRSLATAFAAIFLFSLAAGADLAHPPAVAFDISSRLNADVVVNNGLGPVDTSQVSIDSVSDASPGWAFVTQSVAAANAATPGGLPDDGFVHGTATRPDVQLYWRNDDNGNNAWQFRNDATVTVDAPAGEYERVEIYATAGHADGPGAELDVTLHYTDGDEVVTGRAVPDWYWGAPAGTYVLIDDLDRAEADDPENYDNADNPAIFAVVIPADPGRTLTAVTIEVDVNAEKFEPEVLTIFGMAAVGEARLVLPADVPLASGWGLLALIAAVGLFAVVRLRA